MSEIALQNQLERMFRSESDERRKIQISNSTLGVTTVDDLVLGREFEINIEKPLTHKLVKNLSRDTFHGQRPDIALVSRSSGQTRIIIEVKQSTDSTHKEPDASQFVRNLLYLLATTDRNPLGKADIGRALLAAAPDAWFTNERKSRHWKHLIRHYASLATAFGITLGEIRTDRLLS